MRLTSHSFTPVLAVLTSSTLWSCNADNGPTLSAMATQEAEMMQQVRANCPNAVQGAEIVVSDTEGGVALTCTTGAANLSEVRTRVRNLARMYDMHRGNRSMMWHRMGGEGMAQGEGMAHGSGTAMEDSGLMPAASSTVTNTDDGARIELRPNDPAQLEALRQHIRSHQQRMQSGECWSLQTEPPEVKS